MGVSGPDTGKNGTAKTRKYRPQQDHYDWPRRHRCLVAHNSAATATMAYRLALLASMLVCASSHFWLVLDHSLGCDDDVDNDNDDYDNCYDEGDYGLDGGDYYSDVDDDVLTVVVFEDRVVAVAHPQLPTR